MEHGGLYSDSERQRIGLACVGIAYDHIKQRRERREVTRARGGFLPDYVPFYFGPRSPMLYAIGGGNVKGYMDGEDSILHLVSSTEAMAASGLSFAFTDGHAEMAVSQFFDEVSKLVTEVDWEVVRSKYWNDIPEYPDRKRKRQAEFLVYQFVPWRLVERIGVKDATRKAQVEKLLATAEHAPSVGVERSWYYK